MNPAENIPTVVLVDDHQVFLDGLQLILEHGSRVNVIGRAPNAGEAEAIVSRTRPDLIVLDVDLGDGALESNIRRLLRASPRSRVVVLTMHTSPALRDQALRCGASAYVSKSASGFEVETALISALQGGHPVPLSMSTIGEFSLLTSRERDVLRLVALAMSNRQIGDHLSITEGTVKRHASSAYAKLNAASRLDAVQKATQLGLI